MTQVISKNIVVILGTARSGTSVLARGLKALGIELGTELTPANAINVKGFWEDREIVFAINEKVLNALHCRWDSISEMTPSMQMDPTLNKLKAKAIALLENRFKHTDWWAFKDPRTVKVLCFWQSVFASMNLRQHYVIALRDPLLSALSYQRITGADLPHGYLLWLTHLLAAIKGTTQHKRIVVAYENMMQDPIKELTRIHQQFALPFALDRDEINTYANGFLDQRLQHFNHQRTTFAQGATEAFATQSQLFYECLQQLASDQWSFDDPLFMMSWQRVTETMHQLTPIIHYIDGLLQANNHYRYSFRKLHQSRLWKLIYPLRVIDDFLRKRRKKFKKVVFNDS